MKKWLGKWAVALSFAVVAFGFGVNEASADVVNSPCGRQDSKTDCTRKRLCDWKPGSMYGGNCVCKYNPENSSMCETGPSATRGRSQSMNDMDDERDDSNDFSTRGRSKSVGDAPSDKCDAQSTIDACAETSDCKWRSANNKEGGFCINDK